jgi:protocatechuate 3,4-dioxygenase beta subunit
VNRDFDRPVTRRSSLLALGGLVVAALGWKADTALSAEDGPASVASGLVTCVLSPGLTEGPYYVSGEKVRRNITEGRPGAPLALALTVFDASTCKPIKGAAVDIWHCDALGVYSGVQGNSGTFMRGVQRTDAKGLARFTTVYPGWYNGRAVHIHVKVHVGGNVVHTGQFFFNDAVTDAVYTRAPYNTRGERDIRDSNDSIYRNGGSKSLLAVKESGTGYIGAITMGVHRS